MLGFVCLVACNNKPAEDTPPVDEAKLAMLNQLKQQVALHPDSASLRMQYINALDSLSQYALAIAQTDSMIRRDSANNGLWFARGQLLEANKDTFAAITSYEKALNIYPSIEAQLSLANLFAETKNRNALSICQQVSKLGLGRETDASCDFIAGIYYARTAQYEAAIKLFDRSINNNYTYMEAYMEKGFIYFDTKRYNEALKIFEQAVTVQNTYADAFYWQAKCYEALGNKEEAILNYQRAAGLDKQLAEARQALKRLE